MSFAIRANNLVKKFGDLTAVNDITFEVSPGETFGILGENGAGKSTTMRMIACRSPLTSGSLTVGGFDVRTDERQIRAQIGIVPQENNLDPDLKVLENWWYIRGIFGSRRKRPRNEAASCSSL
jgi:lipooligosaccharide transport system ATP-binding protein